MAKSGKKSKSAKSDGAVAEVTEAAAPVVEHLSAGPKNAENAYAKDVSIDMVGPKKGFNNRTVFDEEELAELSRNIKVNGIIQPPIVRPAGKDGHYHLITGERRWRAAQKAGLKTIPVIIRDISDDADAQVIAMTTDTGEMSKPLTDLDRAHAIARLKNEFKMEPAEIAKRIGVHVKTIQRDLDLIEAPKDVLKLVKEQGVSKLAALELSKVSEPAERKKIVDTLGEDVTEASVRRAVKEMASEKVEAVEGKSTPSSSTKSKGKSHNRDTGTSRASKLVTPRSRTVVTQAVKTLCYTINDIRNGENKAQVKEVMESHDYTALFATTYAALWMNGEFKEEAILPPIGDIANDEVEPNAEARQKRLDQFWKKVEYYSNIEERARKEIVAKEAKKNKKSGKASAVESDEDSDGDEAESEELAEALD